MTATTHTPATNTAATNISTTSPASTAQPTAPSTAPSAASVQTHTVLRAEGFSCPSCVAKIEKQVGRLEGVTAVTVHFASARIEIDHDAALVGVDQLVAAVAKAGFTATPSAF